MKKPLLSSLFAAVISISATAPYSLSKKISKEYVKSFDTDIEEEKNIDEPLKVKKYNKMDDLDVSPASLSSADMVKIGFEKIFSNSDQFSSKEKIYSDILNSYFWKDIKILLGTVNNPGYNLISRLDNTITSLGRCCLAGYLVTPTDSISDPLFSKDYTRYMNKKFYWSNPETNKQVQISP